MLFEVLAYQVWWCLAEYWVMHWRMIDWNLNHFLFFLGLRKFLWRLSLVFGYSSIESQDALWKFWHIMSDNVSRVLSDLLKNGWLEAWHFMWWVSMVGNLVSNVVVNVGGHRWEWLPKEWRCPYVRWTRRCKKWCERCLRMFVQLSPLALIESGVTCGALVPALRKLNSRFDWS